MLPVLVLKFNVSNVFSPMPRLTPLIAKVFQRLQFHLFIKMTTIEQKRVNQKHNQF